MHQAAADAERDRIDHVGSATAGTVVTERIDAFPGGLDAHLVGQHGQRDEEVGCRDKRLRERSGRMAIAFQRHVFKVEWLVAQGRGSPGVGGQSPGARLELFVADVHSWGIPPLRP